MNGARKSLGPIRRVLREQPRRVGLLWAAFFLGFLALPVVVLTVRAGALPGAVRSFDVVGGIRETLTLAMPFAERLHYLAEQPVLEVAVRDALGATQLEYTLVVHNVVTFAVLAGLVTMYAALLGDSLRWSRGYGSLRERAAMCGGLLGSTGVALSGATLSAAACCGGLVTPVILAVLSGTAAGAVIAATDREVVELGGMAVMAGSVLYLASRKAALEGGGAGAIPEGDRIAN